MEWLDRTLISGVTVKQLLLLIAGLIVFRVVWSFVKRDKPSNKLTPKVCAKCKWEGPAAIENRQCSKCGGPLRPA